MDSTYRAATESGPNPVIDLTGDGRGTGTTGLAPRSKHPHPAPVAPQRDNQRIHTGNVALSKEEILERKLQAALRRDKYPVGPKLQSLLRQQEDRGVREYYGLEHLQRMLRYECHSVSPSIDKTWCKKVHPPGCKECKTCHFCRQKTTDLKTWCPCANSGCKQVGGAGRGIWCGNCLQLRIGENINEVLEMRDWRCPACRHICNCSSKTCQRAVRGLDPTEQLHSEARNMGYKSVAHYLILVSLDEKGLVNPMAEVSAAGRQPTQRRPAGAQTTQQPGADGAAIPGAAQTAAALRAQAQHHRWNAERRSQEVLEAVAAVLRPVADPQLESAMAGLGMGPAAPAGADDDDDDDDDDVMDSVGLTSSGMFDCASHGTTWGAVGPGHRLSSAAGGKQQQPQQQQAHDNNSRVPGRAGSAPAGPASHSGLMSPRPVAGRRSDGVLPACGVPLRSASPSPGPMGTARQNTHGLADLGMLNGSGVLGLANFADSWRDRMASPIPGTAAAAGVSGVEAGSRPAAAAATNSEATAVRPQPQQQQPHHPQQQQQHGQRECEHPAPHPLQQQRQQRLQAAQEDYGPHDLPGRDAPGCMGETAAWKSRTPPTRPLGTSINQRPLARQQQKVSGWLSAAAVAGAGVTTRRPAGPRQPPGTSRGAAGTGRCTPTDQPATRAAFSHNCSPTEADAAASNGDAFFTVSINTAAVRSAEAAGLAQGLPSKRVRLDPMAEPAMGPVAADAVSPPPTAGTGPQPSSGMPSAAATIGDDATMPHEQQQQRSQRLGQEPGSADAVTRPAVDRDEAEAQHDIRQVKRAAKLLRVLQDRGLAGRLGADSGCFAQHLRPTMNGLEQKVFHDWDSPLVVNRFADTEAGRAAAAANLQKLQNGVEVLLVLADTLPLVDVRFVVVGRLDGSTCAFLDFQRSDPIARATLLEAWYRLMNIVINRANPGSALHAAEAAASSTQQPAAGTIAAERAVQKAITACIDDVQSGLECLVELANAFLGWLNAFQEEYSELQKLQYSPRDLLGPITVGHLRWPSAHLPQQPAGGAAWHLQQQEQLRQDDIRQQRLLELSTLARADSKMLLSLLAHVCELCRRLPRKVAAALLEGGQLGVMLDMKLLWPAEVCKQALVTIKALSAAAAPDLQEVGRWYIEEPTDMKALLVKACQQQQQQQTTPGFDEVVQQQLALFQQVVYSQIPATQRAAEVSTLAQVMKQHMLLPLEQLVAAEFAARQNWVKDNLEPKSAAPPPPHQQPQTSALPWYLQQKGAPPANAAVTAAATKAPSVQQQEEQEQHSFRLGSTKVEVLAVVYAMQLQAGAINWLQMERQLVAPASRLDQLLEAFQNQQLRWFLACMVAGISKHSPSVVLWQQQQQQQHPHQSLQPVATGVNQTLMPAEWVLRLWLRAMFDVPKKGCRKSAASLTAALLENPAAAGLFQFLSDDEVQQVHYIKHDQFGQLRARWVCQVGKALLAGAHVTAGVNSGSSWGGTGVAGLRYQELRDMLDGLPQVLRARQSELERCGQHSAVLLWQRASMPAVLGLAELIADALATCNCLAPGAAGTSASAAPAPPPHLMVNDLKKTLMELLGLTSSWVRDSITAVCGRGAGSHSSGEASAAWTAASARGGVDPQEAMLLICQSSALAELQKYLAVLVHLAGLGCKLDDISTDQWPADASSSSSRSLRQVWAQVMAAQRTQLQQHTRTAGHHNQHAAAGQAMSIPCLGNLVLALVQLPSAADTLPPSEQALFSYVAAALAGCGGLTAGAAAATTPDNSPNAAPVASDRPERAAAVARVPEGYSSPGLLHLLLGSHIRALLDASSERGTLAAHSKAVNALHLVRALLDQPGVLLDYGQQLLLPCLARPLVKVLGAAAASPVVQFQVFQVLQQLFVDQLRHQVQHSVPEGADERQSVGWNGCLRTMTPLEPSKLRMLLHLLLTASIRASIGAVAAPISPDAAAAAESMLRRGSQRMQQPAVELSQAAAATTAAPATAAAVARHLFPLQPADTQALELQMQNTITGSPPVVSAQLSSALLTADARVHGKGAVKYGAERPEDYAWTLAKGVLGYCAGVAKLQGLAQQMVVKAMPCLLLVMQRGGVAAAPLHGALAHLVEQMPESSRQTWRSRLAGIKNVVAQEQERQRQQQRMAPPPNRPLQGGNQQARSPGKQQQQRPRQPQQLRQQKQQERQPAAAAAAAANMCSSQAASVACAGRQPQQDPDEHHDAGQHKRAKIAVPAQSEVHSDAGGRAASCTVLLTQQQAVQPSQGPQQPGQQLQQPAVSAQCVGHRLAQRSPAAAACGDDDEISSGACRTSSAADGSAVHKQQRQQQPDPLVQPDTSSQDQGQQKEQVPPAQQQQARQPPSGPDKYVLFGSLEKVSACHGGQLVLRMTLYHKDKGRSRCIRASGDALLSGRLADCARALLKRGHIKEGGLLALSEMLPTEFGQYVPSDTSKLHLDPHITNHSGGKVPAVASIPEAALGKENVATVVVAEAKAAPGVAAGVSNTSQAAAAAAAADALNTVPDGVESAAEHQEVAALIETVGTSTTQWSKWLKKYQQLKSIFQQQAPQRRATELQSTQASVSQSVHFAGPCAAVAAASAAATQQLNADVAPAPVIEDSQATIKYATQVTEV